MLICCRWFLLVSVFNKPFNLHLALGDQCITKWELFFDQIYCTTACGNTPFCVYFCMWKFPLKICILTCFDLRKFSFICLLIYMRKYTLLCEFPHWISTKKSAFPHLGNTTILCNIVWISTSGKAYFHGMFTSAYFSGILRIYSLNTAPPNG